jgi:hypothetical protein
MHLVAVRPQGTGEIVNFRLLIICGAMASTALGCNSLDEQIAEQERIRGQVSSAESVNAGNADLERKARAMEADLDLRQRFYQGVSGRFESETITLADGQSRRFQLELVASVPPYRSSRVRALEEIIFDQTGLHLSVRVTQVDPVTGTMWPCTFTEIRPNTATGQIHLIDPRCVITYTFWLMPSTGEPPPAGDPGAVIVAGSAQAARALLDQRIIEIDAFTIRAFSSVTPGALEFQARRSESLGR